MLLVGVCENLPSQLPDLSKQGNQLFTTTISYLVFQQPFIVSNKYLIDP